MPKQPTNKWAGSAQDLAQCYPPSEANGSDGYIRISRNNRTHQMHRWLWENLVGPIPAGYEIDHENGVRTDNRLSNLRAILKKDQRRNAAKRSDNISGIQGVSFWVTGNAWRATAHNHQGKQVIRTFSVNKYGDEKAFRLASEKRKELEIQYGYHPNHGR